MRRPAEFEGTAGGADPVDGAVGELSRSSPFDLAFAHSASYNLFFGGAVLGDYQFGTDGISTSMADACLQIEIQSAGSLL